MKSGAVGFLTKPFRDQDLLDAIQQAQQRENEIRRQHHEIRELQEHYQTLTAREREVMGLRSHSFSYGCPIVGAPPSSVAAD